ncbi:M23 family metallopeptidase [uncultured Aeromicrobium sp.]|uniref:M23 family metallopeptidase n=1 Tax=uncultured Aeromicrobium sp. TaxID=337820 RepID=UPI0025FCD398|nr:peptidoglycan DD-metalloendopeptidase family protein [uncultured Aeromicrobium sp.]
MASLTTLTTALVALPLVLLPQDRSPSWLWPLSTQRVERPFDVPRSEYGPGHRGVDIPGRPGEDVRAVAAGTVTFTGQVAGILTVTVDHGVERSTYQPVAASVAPGDAVSRGDLLGTLLPEHPSCSRTCLNLGRLRGEEYLDPVDRLRSGGSFRLISPEGPPPKPPSWHGSGLVNLLGGPVTSPFGMRVHPITGERKLHDGVDIAAACGTPVPALAAGRVSRSEYRGAYGEHVEIIHDDGRATSYSHLSRRQASVGHHVAAGDVIGAVGSTGRSTGCHLHLMLLVDGSPVDPLSAAPLDG